MPLTQVPTAMVKEFNLGALNPGDVLTFNGTNWVAQPGVPSGTILQFAGATAPNGWLLCDGLAVSRTTFAGLFGAIGTAYGAGDGTTTFNLPDFRGRIPLGRDNMGGTSANRVLATQADVLGGSGGAETRTPTGSVSLSGTVGDTTLSSIQIPSHTHTPNIFSANWSANTSPNGWGSGTWSGTGSGAVQGGNSASPQASMIGNTGGGGSHSHSFSGSGSLTGTAMDITQPWLTVHYIIKA